MERVVSTVLGGLLALDALSSFSKGKPLRGILMSLIGGGMLYRGTSGYCFVYRGLGVTGEDAAFASHPLSRETHVTESITILKSPNEVYGFWRDFRNLPRVMKKLERVDVFDEKRSHWTVRGPQDRFFEWDAEIVEDDPGELIAWRSTGAQDVWNRGSVRFQQATAGRGTTITVDITYRPPAGVVGAAYAWATGNPPALIIRRDLRRLKYYLETGELPAEGQP